MFEVRLFGVRLFDVRLFDVRLFDVRLFDVRRRRVVIAALGIAGLFGGGGFGSLGPTGSSARAAEPGPCEVKVAGAMHAANELLRNHYTLGRNPTVTLPVDPRWNENPVGDPNWEYLYHSLRFTEPLWAAWTITHKTAYRARYEFLLHDWFRDNPISSPPSPYSWNDHSTAWRGVAYACARDRLPWRGWLDRAAMLHGRMLASEHFYVHHGNHALNQAAGLLLLACQMNAAEWRALAVQRIERLARESIDAQGVINEQALGYQYYNYRRYSSVMAQMGSCAIRPSAEMERRVARMPAFLAFAALPNDRFEMLGDTLDDLVPSIEGTAMEFVASGGKRGHAPDAVSQVYNAGYAFFRSGWGERRPLVDETAVAVRFGPGRRFHGHRDAASVTMYTGGDRVLLDPGMYHFKRDIWRYWVKSGRAHNTISVDDAYMTDQGNASLVGQSHAGGYDYVVVRHNKISGVTHTRRVFYSRRLNVVVVDDDLRSARPRRFRQWWHLHPDAAPSLSPDGFYTGRAGSRANAWVVQLAAVKSQKILRASKNPFQGWVSFVYNRIVPAPVVNIRADGTHVRYVTLIVPSASAGRAWRVHRFTLHRDGYDLDLERNGRRARIVERLLHASQAAILS